MAGISSSAAVTTLQRVWVEAGFLLAASTSTTVALFLSCLPRGAGLPESLSALVLYGKTAPSHKSKGFFYVPKSWFTHFYMCACILMSFIWLESFVVRRHGTRCPRATLVLVLFTFQVLRRLYECLFVHIFSSKGSIHVCQYAIGLAHYIGVAFLLRKMVLRDSPGTVAMSIASGGHPIYNAVSLSAILLFCIASFYQHKAHVCLRLLREHGKRKSSHLHYPPPATGIFRYLLCPNYTCEILVYVSLALLLRWDPSWCCVLFWVISNQLLTGYLSLKWYRKMFPTHVAGRSAVIPFLS